MSNVMQIAQYVPTPLTVILQGYPAKTPVATPDAKMP
jgi:hypothetical protein